MTLAPAPNLAPSASVEFVFDTGTRLVLRAQGEFDLATNEVLPEAVDRWRRPTHDELWLNGSGISFVDAAGLNVMLTVRRWCSLHGTAFLLITPSRAVRRVMNLTGVCADSLTGELHPGIAG